MNTGEDAKMEEGDTNEIPYYDKNFLLEKNENFFNYYVKQKIINEDEIDDFMEIINTELPITFRVLKNNKYSNFINENIKKKLQEIGKNNYAVMKLNEEDEMYEIYLTRSQIKKEENYKNLYNYLINLNESGYIFRQELVSMLPVLFLKLQENFFVLDICAAPGSKTAQIVDYMHLIKKKNVKNLLIKRFLEKSSSTMSKFVECIKQGDDDMGAIDVQGTQSEENRNNTGNTSGKDPYISNMDTSDMFGNAAVVTIDQPDIVPIGGSRDLGKENNKGEDKTNEQMKGKRALKNKHEQCCQVLENNMYDDEFFEYILNVDNNLYEEYKKLISNNNPSGVVVANDANFKRCCMLFHRLKNIHSNCLVVTNNNAINFPYIYMKNEKENTTEKKFFDSVLCDVPCSGDGTLRKDRNIWLNWNPINAYNLFQLQVNILKRSIELTKEGGHIVYSTCSLNPIENEAVICEIFNSIENFNSLKLINFENDLIKKLNFKEGLKEWKLLLDDKWFDTFDEFCYYIKSIDIRKYKKVYDKIQYGMFTPEKKFMDDINLKFVKRFFPHYYNAGGFFIAVIKKCGKVQWKEKTKKDKRTKKKNNNFSTKNVGEEGNLYKERKTEHRKKYKNRKNKKKNKKKRNVTSEAYSNGTKQSCCDDKEEEEEKKNKKVKEQVKGNVNRTVHGDTNGARDKDTANNFNILGSDDFSKGYHILGSDDFSKGYHVLGSDDLSKSYHVLGSDDLSKSYHALGSDDLSKSYHALGSDQFVKNYTMVGSDYLLEGSFHTRSSHRTSNGDIIHLINKKSEEELSSYINNGITATEEGKEWEILHNSDDPAERSGDSSRRSSDETKGRKSQCGLESANIEHTHVEEGQIQMGDEKLTKQREYISLDYYEKLFCVNNFLEKIKNYFNFNDDFLSIKNNLYIHLKDDSNFCRLPIKERINECIKKINFVSNNTKDILECYTKIKLKIISAGITVIQIDKNKKNGKENYYRINYSGCLNFIPFFKQVDNFLLCKIYREKIIKKYFSPVYENDKRIFHFEDYMNRLIGERKSTMSKESTNKNNKDGNNTLSRKKMEYNDMEFTHIDNCANGTSIVKNELEKENQTFVPNEQDKSLNVNEMENDVNTIWVGSDAILDLIKVDKSKINNITNETIKQTEKLTKYSPNILLTLNKNKQILAIPSSKGNVYVDISIDKNSIIMLPYILN
ncbi:tRNA m5C-methyltransferase, putative [Plasmodium ovale]|uniref:NOL1/NOP2/sun family methyltransferase n=2 Tax=Plasmodium ovale TaxID=36330 RepID=A0A1A8VLZ7_PLAOA|nr:NOL1/NOP2/sun family methyltransferase [Plasmodium ovale curtisi]SBS80286.1 NOL1/NOP2/sun family methyltransferase [Plasmodium ovale curtisi]SCD22304.1 tRNA m5C-methyltransferase, putative [Plasmodium ovale]